MKSSFKTIFLLTCFFFTTTVQAQAEERTAASELLKVTQFEQLMDNSTSHTIDLLKQMDPEMAKHEEALNP